VDKRHYFVNLGELISELRKGGVEKQNEVKTVLRKEGGVRGEMWRQRASNEGCARKQDGGRGIKKQT